MPGIHKHILDFEILETGNPKTLVFVDASQYMEEPERPLLEVVMPGYNKYTIVNVTAKRVNTFNSSTLKINQVLDQDCLINLPDGVWELKYKICPYTKVYVVKRHMRISLLKEKLAHLEDQIDLADCQVKDDENIKADLVNVYMLIEGAKNVVNRNPTKASKYYQLADKLVSKLIDKLCKNCK